MPEPLPIEPPILTNPGQLGGVPYQSSLFPAPVPIGPQVQINPPTAPISYGNVDWNALGQQYHGFGGYGESQPPSAQVTSTAPADSYQAPIRGLLGRIPAAQLINGIYAISQGRFMDQTPIGRLFSSLGHLFEGTLGEHQGSTQAPAQTRRPALPLPSLNYNDVGIPAPNIGPMYNYGPGAFTTPYERAAAGGASPYQLAGAQFSSPAQNALLMASQAYGGNPNNTGTTQDAGHTRFYGGLQRGMIQDGVVVPADPSEQMAGPERRFVNSPALSFWDIISGGGGMVPSAPAPISFSAPPIASLPPLPPGIPGFP